MLYHEQAPSAALRTYVEAYWTIDAPAGAPAHRVLPDGCIDLLFGSGFAGARVIGPMTHAIVAPAAGERTFLFGVRFHPGEAAPLLGVAARELRDRAYALGDVWGPAARALSDAVLSAPSFEARTRAAERVLLARIASLRGERREDVAGGRIRETVRALRAANGTLTVDGLAGLLGATPRTLERACDERVGLGPKLLARVVRLQSLVAAVDRAPVASWSGLAAELSFADQAHLVREVADLAGATPTEILLERRGMSDLFNTERAGAPTVPPSPVLSGRRKEEPR